MVRRLLLLVLLAVVSFIPLGCKNSLLDRSLIFSTHTTLGLEASVSPAESGQPGKLIIGYQRTEGVINPVYHSGGIKTPETEKKTDTRGTTATKTATVKTPGGTQRYRKEAYSVIAKFRGETGGSAKGVAEGKLSVAQWFATGEAAKTLAKQPGIAGAVAGSSDIAKAAVEQARFAATLEGESLDRGMIILSHIYTHLQEMAKTDPQARDCVNALDELVILVPDEFTAYQWSDPATDPPTLTTETLPDAEPDIEWKRGFDTVLVYKGYLDDSVRTLNDAKSESSFKFKCKGAIEAEDPTEGLKSVLWNALSDLEDDSNKLKAELTHGKGMVSAVKYYCETLLK
ncbi:MAG: hypothetical protein JSU70_07670 [Phycisphaerales bacterium]|nr:MAG: hypothetical protein JSU70_07670 [Phycisphaerales bacterium]